MIIRCAVPAGRWNEKQVVKVIMAALRSRCGHYIFALWFLSIYLFLFLA